MQEDNDNGLMKHQGVDMDTSILLHLIGQDGAGELEFMQLCTFMNNRETLCHESSSLFVVKSFRVTLRPRNFPTTN